MSWLAAVLMAAMVLSWPSWDRRRLPTGPASLPPPQPGTASQLPVPVVLDLLCAALEAGLSTNAALAATVDACGAALAPGVRSGLLSLRAGTDCSAGAHGELLALTRALHLAERTGASVAPLLRRAAVDARDERSRRTAVAAGRLGVRLVLPLGLATLPSFVLLGVVPVVLGLARQVLQQQ